MSFGFSVGDFLAVTELAWNLYRYCYVIARGAPQEFQHLVQEIATLSQSIQLLQEEAKNPNSTLVRSGDDRIRMVREMIKRLEVTLKELEVYAKKYAKLGDTARAKRKQIWDKFKWSVDASSLDSLRNKLVYHNGIINLLLTSCGNSSLQRIESSNMRLETSFSQIGDLIHKAEGSPMISCIGGGFKIPLLSAELMKYAEVGQRRWSSIGVDEWIQAGKWWLLKSQCRPFPKATSAHMAAAGQRYADLIKSSWILIDVIARHPQLNLLDSTVRYDTELLADAIRTELESRDASTIPKPTFEEIRECDLGIWVPLANGSSLQPLKGMRNAGNGCGWQTDDEYVLAQRFAHYQSSDFGNSTPCVILFVAQKNERRAQIQLRDQRWITLATLIVGKIRLLPVGNFVHIGDQKIEFPTPEEAQYLAMISEAVEEYVFYLQQKCNVYLTLPALTLLFAVKHGHQELVERLTRAEPSRNWTSTTLQQAIWQLATQPSPKTVHDNESQTAKEYKSLVFWAVHEGHMAVAAQLLKWKNILVASEQECHQWVSLHDGARNGRVEAVKFILSENGANIHDEDGEGRTAFELAACNGHVELVKELLLRGAVYRERYHRSLTTLQEVAGTGNESMVELMIEAGADVHAPAANSPCGRTSLWAAAKGGHMAVVERLLKAGVDVNTGGNGQGGTALSAAAGAGYVTVVERLLKAGAVVDTGRDCSERLAATGGHAAVIKILSQEGAGVHS